MSMAPFRTRMSLLAAGALVASVPVLSVPAQAQTLSLAGAPTAFSAPAVAIPAGYSLGDRTLRKGKRGADVKALQKLLGVKQTGYFNKKTKKAVKKVEGAYGLKRNGIVSKKTLKYIKKDARAKSRAAKKRSSSSRGGLPATGSPAANKRYAAAYIAKEYGWGSSQMSCLSSVWTRESGWRHNVSNPNGKYHGIPQTSSAVWRGMGYSNSAYMNNPDVQIKVGAKYIKNRYGTPCSAWSFWRSHHWY